MKLFGILILAVVLVWMAGVHLNKRLSQTDFNCDLKESYIKGNLDQWPKKIKTMESYDDRSFDWQLKILLARYVLIGYYLEKDKNDLASDLLKETDNLLAALMREQPNSAKLYSVQAGFYGYKILLSIYKGPFLLPKNKHSIEQALRIDADEPLAWLEQGNTLYNRPKAFGGDKIQAIQCFKKSLNLLQNQENADCDWMIVMLKVFLVKAYYQTDQTENYKLARYQLEEDYGNMEWIDDFINSSLF